MCCCAVGCEVGGGCAVRLLMIDDDVPCRLFVVNDTDCLSGGWYDIITFVVLCWSSSSRHQEAD